MNNKFLIVSALFCVLALSGCVNREQADAKLAKACEAAVGAFLGDTQRIDKIKDAQFSGDPQGPDFRHVKINTIMIDGWLETEYSYDCVFQEGFGFLNSGYTASIERVTINEKTIGRSGNEVLGDANDHMKLNEAVRGALYGN